VAARIFGSELTDLESGEPLAVLDLAWPEGLQAEQSEPVALLLDEPRWRWQAALASAASRVSPILVGETWFWPPTLPIFSKTLRKTDLSVLLWICAKCIAHSSDFAPLPTDN